MRRGAGSGFSWMGALALCAGISACGTSGSLDGSGLVTDVDADIGSTIPAEEDASTASPEGGGGDGSGPKADGGAGQDGGGAASGDGAAGGGPNCGDAAVIPPKPIDTTGLPVCCGGLGHCVPQADLPAGADQALDVCAGGLCAPDDLLATGGAKPPSCASLNNAAGVCLSTCVPQVSKYASLLPQASCTSTQKCAPCINPLTSASSGACDIGATAPAGTCAPSDGGAGDGASSSDAGDAATTLACPYVGPPVIDPSLLTACGAGAHCLPTAAVPATLTSKLAACPNNGGLCVPDVFIAAGGNYVPPTCTAIGGYEGRCLNVVLPDVAAEASLLTQTTCAAYEKCTPCYSPLDLSVTGACNLSCDPGPTKPVDGCPHQGPPILNPNAYTPCSSYPGAHCLAPSLVPASMASELSKCNDGVSFCVPDPFIAAAGRYVPPTCSSIGGAEGRCLHRSIPQVAAQASELPQSTCAYEEACVPCYDPLDGSDTGACRLSCDPGPQEPPYVFQACCYESGGTAGKCVPQSMVPSSEAANLTRDVCGDPSTLCVPTENLDPNFSPTGCSAFALVYFGYYDGVCLSDCIQFTGIQGLVIKQGSCDYRHQCVPCTTPTGAPSGAPGCN